MRVKDQMIARRRLDGRVQAIREQPWAPPRSGWTRAIRDALGMPARVLADRLGVHEQAVYRIERSEAAGTIQLDTLRRAADALDCDVVYALVPRTSLDDSLHTIAMQRARHDVAATNQTMRLEAQALSTTDLERDIADYAAELIATGRVWT